MHFNKSILLERFNIEVTLSNPEVIYKETPINTGDSHIRYRNKHPFPAEIALKIEPTALGSGLKYKTVVSFGYITKSSQKAIEEAVHEIAKEGLHGYEVTDCLVTFTDAYFNSFDSTAAAFRSLTPIAFMEALDDAKTKLLEPINTFTLSILEDEIGKCLFDLKNMRAVYNQPVYQNSKVIIKGIVPVSTSFKYRIELASTSKGKGIFETSFIGYHESNNRISTSKERSFINPLNRKLYLKALQGVIK